MRITQVSLFYLPVRGGQEVYVSNLDRILRENNLSTQVIQLSARGADRRDNVITLPCIWGLGRLWFDLKWVLFNIELSLLMKRTLRQSDVIISHYPFHYPALKWHEKVVVVSHGVDWQIPPHTIVDKYKAYSARLCREHGACIVANDTHFLRSVGYDVRSATSYFQEVNTNTWFIPNCVDTERFRPIASNRENIILVPRNIRRVRGIHLAIESFRLFVKRNRDFTMHIVGGPLMGSYYKYCLSLVKKYDLTQKVIFWGSVHWDELVEYYNRSKLTLIPTLELEGTSLSALESMACKTPVVSTNVAGLNDLPTLKAEPTAESISHKMQEALADWEAIRKSQYDQTLATFNLNNWERAWLSVINRVTASIT